MRVTPSGPVRRRLRPVLPTLVFWLTAVAVACADTTMVDGLSAPIVRVNIRQGDVTIRTWTRASVAIDGDPSLVVERRIVNQPPEAQSVPIGQASQNTRDGPIALPAENFVVSSVPAGPRDVVIVHGGSDPTAHVIVTIPSNSVFLFALAMHGNLDVHDYSAGTLVAFTTRGALALDDIHATTFAQTGRGTFTATDSTFDRIRARSLEGNMTFEGCRTQQIEATSINGSIVYDRGAFDPGLAHFESTRGDVAIGTQTPAQLGGHVAGEGRVFTSFDRRTAVDDHGTDASALVGGGGPVVTATTQSGNVYLYDGSLRTRARLSSGDWRAPYTLLARRAPAQYRPIERSNPPGPMFTPFPASNPQAPQWPRSRYAPPATPRRVVPASGQHARPRPRSAPPPPKPRGHR